MAKNRGNGKGKGRNKKLIRDAIRGGAKYAFGGELAENKKERRQLRNQGREIEQAYDAYAGQMEQIQRGQLAQQLQARERLLAGAGQLQGVADAATAGQQDALGKQAGLLGQGSTATDTYGALGAAGAQTRANMGALALAGDANIGVARLTDLGSRAATGQRDRIASKEELQGLKRENAQERQEIKARKGGWMAEKLYEYIQQQKENRIAKMGLRGEQADRRQDRREHEDEMDLARDQLAADIADDQADNEREDRESRGNGNSGGGGLSPSAQDDYRKAIDGITAVSKAYDRLRSNQGLSHSSAMKKALRSAGGEAWMAKIAKQLAQDGSLGKQAERVLRANLPPGAKIPRRWR